MNRTWGFNLVIEVRNLKGRGYRLESRRVCYRDVFI